jgi:hypothetical protein
MRKPKDTRSDKDGIIVRLDALIRITLELSKNKGSINQASTARILKSVGLTPTEVARILGKKSATEVAAYLYKKK